LNESKTHKWSIYKIKIPYLQGNYTLLLWGICLNLKWLMQTLLKSFYADTCSSQGSNSEPWLNWKRSASSHLNALEYLSMIFWRGWTTLFNKCLDSWILPPQLYPSNTCLQSLNISINILINFQTEQNFHKEHQHKNHQPFQF
jgi:hypothetical protein